MFVNMDLTTASSTPAVKLTSVEHWSKWIGSSEADGRRPKYNIFGTKSILTCHMPDQDSDLLKKPVMPSTVKFHEYVKKNKTAVHTPSMLETIQYYNVIHH
ncbi:hypothetical protein E4U19_000844 [Claviceps sp. Clav32 group G5]|nr:hypothetical protein E4U19_000844 [Claviceps sp. Clav32 group G5]KAG6044712.1 hypothetical protein E4U39_003070 [Claviceps sp. Clav50 group G5]